MINSLVDGGRGRARRERPFGRGEYCFQMLYEYIALSERVCEVKRSKRSGLAIARVAKRQLAQIRSVGPTEERKEGLELETPEISPFAKVHRVLFWTTKTTKTNLISVITRNQWHLFASILLIGGLDVTFYNTSM